MAAVSAPTPKLDRYIVIHVATTCDEHGVYVTKDSAEVIELGWILLDSKTCEEVHTIPEPAQDPPTVFPCCGLFPPPQDSPTVHVKSHKMTTAANNLSFDPYSSTVKASSSSLSTLPLRRCAVSLPLAPSSEPLTDLYTANAQNYSITNRI